MMTRVSIVEDTNPPTMGAAIRFMTRVPVSVPKRIGRRPMVVVATVMSLGRRRSTAPSVMAAFSSASVRSRPSAFQRA